MMLSVLWLIPALSLGQFVVLVACWSSDRPEQDVLVGLLHCLQFRIVVPDLVQSDECPPDYTFCRELEEIFIDKSREDSVPVRFSIEVVLVVRSFGNQVSRPANLYVAAGEANSTPETVHLFDLAERGIDTDAKTNATRIILTIDFFISYKSKSYSNLFSTPIRATQSRFTPYCHRPAVLSPSRWRRNGRR